MSKIRLNKIRCKKCGDVITSKSTHDFKFCKCKAVAIDGGQEYLKRIYKSDLPEDDFEELSEYED